MNERIKELADQANSYADTLDVADQRIYKEIRDREFAELIVKECAEVLDKTISPPSHPMNSIGYRLKEHFGVE